MQIVLEVDIILLSDNFYIDVLTERFDARHIRQLTKDSCY